MDTQSQETWVIVPAYNEEKTIGGVLEEVLQCGYPIVVVNDGSSDHTKAIALQYPVVVLTHLFNLGAGAAFQTGISYVLQHTQARYLVTFDADGQHQAADIPRLVAVCRTGDYQVVLGSRFMPGARTININLSKKIVLKFAVLFTNLATRLPLTDTHNGLRVFTREAAEIINITHNGMAHASEILAQVASFRLRFCEAPVTVIYTAYSKRKGQSIWNGINILWDLWMSKIR